MLNLNRVAVLLGVYSNLPWIIGPYYAGVTMAGAKLTGHKLPPGFKAKIAALFDASVFHGEFWRQLFAILKPLLWPYAVGSIIGRDRARGYSVPAGARVRRQPAAGFTTSYHHKH